MAIVNARVDDRLIHGQVATSWIRGLHVEVVVVVDDRIAKDEMQKSILKMSAPADTRVYALSINGFLERYQKGILDKYRVMLVFENVHAPYDMARKGFQMETLNLGGMRFKEGRRQISKALSLSREEEELIRKMAEMGIKIEHRQLTGDDSLDVLSLLEK